MAIILEIEEVTRINHRTLDGRSIYFLACERLIRQQNNQSINQDSICGRKSLQHQFAKSSGIAKWKS